MKISNSCSITSRLLPGVILGNTQISIEYAGVEDNRTKYRYYIDIGRKEYTKDDLSSGCGGGTLQQGLESLLSFLCAAAESWRYAGKNGENSDLFPQRIVKWAAQNSDELAMLRVEIEEGNCIEEN